MSNPIGRAMLRASLALLVAAASPGSTQPAARNRPDPADPSAVVPPAKPPSSLTQYRRFGEQPVGSWREANETVNRIGGWRAYAREASQASAASAPASASASAPSNVGRKP